MRYRQANRVLNLSQPLFRFEDLFLGGGQLIGEEFRGTKRLVAAVLAVLFINLLDQLLHNTLRFFGIRVGKSNTQRWHCFRIVSGTTRPGHLQVFNEL